MPPEVIYQNPEQRIGFQPDGTIRVQTSELPHIESLPDNGQELSFVSRVSIALFIVSLAPLINLTEREVGEIGRIKLLISVASLLTNEREFGALIPHFRFTEEELPGIAQNALRFRDQTVLNQTFLALLPEGSLLGWQPQEQIDALYKILRGMEVLGADNLEELKRQVVALIIEPSVAKEALEVIGGLKEKLPVTSP